MAVSSLAEAVSGEERAAPEDRWAAKIAFYMLWFEYLAISPSYELAQRYRTGALTEAEQAQLPKDFDRVLEVYDDLGDVQRILFDTWWSETAVHYFGTLGSKPKVQRLATLRPKKKTDVAADRLDQFVSSIWRQQGKQPTMIAAIPLGMPKAQVLKAVAALLDGYPTEDRTFNIDPKYRLAGKRQNSNALFAYLRTAHLRSAMPKQELWRVGSRAKISFSYSGAVDHTADLKRSGDAAHERILLTIMTSRALKRAQLIAENAARGVFPSYAPLEEAQPIDYTTLFRKVSSRNKWKRAEQQRLAARNGRP